MTAADRLNKIEARNVPTTWFSDRQADTAALVAALRAVLEEIEKRGKQAREALPPSLAALAVPSYQFNVRASDIIRAIEEALA